MLRFNPKLRPRPVKSRRLDAQEQWMRNIDNLYVERDLVYRAYLAQYRSEPAGKIADYQALKASIKADIAAMKIRSFFQIKLNQRITI